MSRIIIETNNTVWTVQKLVVYVNDIGITLKRLTNVTPPTNVQYDEVEITRDELLSHSRARSVSTLYYTVINGEKWYVVAECFFTKENLNLFWKTGNVLFLSLIKQQNYYTAIAEMRSGEIRSVLDETHFNHLTVNEYSKYLYRSNHYNDLVWLYPLTNQAISECSMLIRIGYENNLITNLTIDQVHAFDTIEDVSKDFLLTAEILGQDTIKQNDTIELTVNLLRNNDHLNIDYVLDIEAVSGYAPNKRCIISNGTGTFQITALGLVPGNKLRVKLNNKSFTSVAEKILTVVE